MNKWKIVHDCDGGNGEPTCWVKEINHSDYDRFVWITEDSKEKFNVEINQGGDFTTLVTRKSLVAAKRWVSMNLR